MDPSRCANCPDRIVELNKAIAAWTPKVTTSQSPVGNVDCWTGFDTDTMTYDGVHPSDAGNVKLAQCWYDRLVQVIQSYD